MKPSLRTIVAGSRSITNYNTLILAVSHLSWTPSVILSGTARGADQLGERWARENNIPLERYPADWDAFGKSAGYKRNALMSSKADALLALWDGQSRGTIHMINLAKQKGLLVHIHNPELWEALYG